MMHNTIDDSAIKIMREMLSEKEKQNLELIAENALLKRELRKYMTAQTEERELGIAYFDRDGKLHNLIL